MTDQLLYNLANQLRRHVSGRPNGPLAGLLATADLSDQWLDACAGACARGTDLTGLTLVRSLRDLDAGRRATVLAVCDGTFFPSARPRG